MSTHENERTRLVTHWAETSTSAYTFHTGTRSSILHKHDEITILVEMFVISDHLDHVGSYLLLFVFL